MSSCLWAGTLPDGMGAHALPQRRGLRWRPWFPTAPTVFDGAHSFPRCPGQQYLPDSSLPQCRHPLCHGTPGHPLCLGAPASNIFQMAFRHGAPASNKPHLAEKSTPVWLAIWRTWAGFANSQLLPDAAAAAPSRALSTESPRSGNFSAQTSASLHPSRSASLAGPSHSRGHGRPRSVRKSYRLREKCQFH